MFPRDEMDEICQELVPIMKKQYPRRPPTNENLYDYFLTRVRQNLHVVLCFSPVGEKFRKRGTDQFSFDIYLHSSLQVFNFRVLLLTVPSIGFFVGHVMHLSLLLIIFFLHSISFVPMQLRKNSFNVWVPYMMVLRNIVYNTFKNIVDQLTLHRNLIFHSSMVIKKSILKN
jgi:hypothetical protein